MGICSVVEEPRIYRGPDAAYEFLLAMKEGEKKIRGELSNIEPM